jgi:hypothetical protein
MARDCVEVLRTHQTVQSLDEVRIDSERDDKQTYLNEGIVQEEHDRGQIPGDPGVPEQVLTDITHITNMGMTQAELPVRLLAQYSKDRSGRTYQIVSEVYSTTAAMNTVRIKPGTRPRTE